MKYSTQVKKTLSKAINHVSNNVGKFTNKPDTFIRKRKWTPEKIIRIMFSMDNHDLHSSIFSALSSQEKKEPFSVSGFIQQRDKLTLNMFSFIFRTVLKSMTSYIKDHTFRGYHLLACDGSDFPLPTDCIPSASDAKPERKVQHRLLHENALYDLLSQLYVTVTMEPKLQCNERNSLLHLASSLEKDAPMYTPNKTIIICDRGYEGRNVCAGLIEMGYKFIIRAKSPKGCGILYGCSLKLHEESNLAAANIKLYCKKNCTGQYRACKSSIDCRVLNLRVVMLRLANRDIEYLVTNLSREEFSNEDIAALYRKRWDIEVSFRHQKYAIGGIVFHSKKLNVQQMELYTALTLYNIVFAIIQHTNIPKKKRKAMYKIKFSTAVIFCIEYLFKRGTQNLEKKLQSNLTRIEKNRIFDRNLRRKSARSFNARPR